MRCPKCGNDVSKDDFVCVYCGAKLREERIESIGLFRRLEEEWVEPDPRWKRLINVIINPSRAFWDVTHYRKKVGGGLVYLLTAMAFGLNGLAVFVHLDFSGYLWYMRMLYGLQFFLIFGLFGLFFYMLFYWFGSKLFRWGADYSIDLSRQLELRYDEGDDEEEDEEEQEKTRAQLEAEGEYIFELPDYLKSEKSKKGSIMRLAYMPVVVGLLISALILLIFLPSTTPGNVGDMSTSIAWSIVDWIQVIILIGWVPITMSIALRDIANASTMRVYISCLIISILLAAISYFMRPTFLMGQVA